MWRIRVMVGLIFMAGLAGCGEELADDVATETSALTIIVGGRPMADAVLVPEGRWPDWSVSPSTRARFDAINETTCNNSTDYIYTGVTPSDRLDAGAAFDIDVSGIPTGKTVSSMRAFVCARLHFPFAEGFFSGRVHYWDPAGNGQRILVGNYGDWYRIPSELFGTNPFRLYEVPTTILVSIYPTAKPATGGMRMRLWGNNVDVSQVFLSIGYPTSTPPF